MTTVCPCSGEGGVVIWVHAALDLYVRGACIREF